MTHIWLLRHAEAEGNVYRRNHGHYDSLLTPLGLQQVAALDQGAPGATHVPCLCSHRWQVGAVECVEPVFQDM